MAVEDDDLTLLRGAFAMRAAAYAQMFDVLREEFGEERALKLCKRAIRRMGEAMGSRYAHLAPADLAGLRDAFLGSIPKREAMFAPEVTRADRDCLEIRFHRCPLKEAWQAQGRNEADLAKLCAMAGAIDAGLFTAAGFTFKGATWQPGESGCCQLRIEPGRRSGPDASRSFGDPS